METYQQHSYKSFRLKTIFRVDILAINEDPYVPRKTITGLHPEKPLHIIPGLPIRVQIKALFCGYFAKFTADSVTEPGMPLWKNEDISQLAILIQVWFQDSEAITTSKKADYETIFYPQGNSFREEPPMEGNETWSLNVPISIATDDRFQSRWFCNDN